MSGMNCKLQRLVRHSIGRLLLLNGCFMLISAMIYVVGGGEEWFSHGAVGIISLGLWYAGSSEANKKLSNDFDK